MFHFHYNPELLAAILMAGLSAVCLACGGEPTPTPQAFLGQWITVEDETDPLTGEGEVEILLHQKGNESRPALYIRCYDNGPGYRPRYALDFIIDWSFSPIATSDSPWQVTVQHRIDEGSIESLDWIYSTDYTATFLPSGETSRIIEELFNANEFVARIETDESHTITAEFKPAGIYWAAKPVLDACEVKID